MRNDKYTAIYLKHPPAPVNFAKKQKNAPNLSRPPPFRVFVNKRQYMENDHGEEIKDRLRTVKELEEDIRFGRRIDVARAYGRTMAKVGRRQRRLWLRNTFSRAAAVLFVPLLAGTLVLAYLLCHPAGPPRAAFAEVAVSPGTVMQIELPDRSHVWLNSESRLRYPVEFKGKTRAVELAGEGFFDVRTDAGRPFEVTAPSGLKVVARGTAFNLKAFDDDDTHEAVLQEGMAEVSYRNYHAVMRPGEMVRLDRQGNRIARSAVRTDEKTAWKDGIIIFRNTPMEEVMKQLSRRYNTDIVFHNHGQKSYLIRATFSSETLPQILDFLKLAAPIEWSQTKTEQNGDSTFDRQQVRVTVK
jgi:ferric-dicitrate binding protein FerR (iron transport regulator)